MRTFAVGDIHGYSQKLRKLLPQLRERATSGDALVFIGDYVDRGPDSRGVIDVVLGLVHGGWDGPVTTLKGNHEELMLDSLAKRPRHDPAVWMQNGGVETVGSYTGEGWSPRWARALPPAHLEFLQSLKSWHEDEHAFYVHAGIPPGVHPGEASDDDLLWIRDDFILSDHAWEKVVVFGHTPQYEQPKTLVIDMDKLPWRALDRPEKIGIDTGAAYGGLLTAVVLPDREFISVR